LHSSSAVGLQLPELWTVPRSDGMGPVNMDAGDAHDGFYSVDQRRPPERDVGGLLPTARSVVYWYCSHAFA
jgi:hypothetical protein